MLAYNEVFGKTYEVEPVEALDPALTRRNGQRMSLSSTIKLITVT